jgi:hypothetical protein
MVCVSFLGLIENIRLGLGAGTKSYRRGTTGRNLDVTPNVACPGGTTDRIFNTLSLRGVLDGPVEGHLSTGDINVYDRQQRWQDCVRSETIEDPLGECSICVIQALDMQVENVPVLTVEATG